MISQTKQLDACLSIKDNHLFIEHCDTVDLVGEFGSPIFVLSEDQLRRNVREFQSAFKKGWPDGPVKVMPAAKANWIAATQRILADEGCGCDIYSAGELSIALVAEGLVPTDLAAIVYKGGLSFEQILSIAPRILKMNNVELVGFHQHHGRHDPSTRYWEEQMKAFAKEIGKVSKALGGFQPKEIDIGGGFAIPRDPFNAVTDYSEPLQLAALHVVSKGLNLLGSDTRYKVLSKLVDSLIITKPNQTPAPTIQAYATACTGTLRQELPSQGVKIEGLMLQVEPGRSMHGNTGIHLTTVKNIKRMREPIRWNVVVVDTTEFWFTGGRYEHHLHEYVFANKASAKMIDKADIIGRSCYGDRLMPTVPIPKVKAGDILALLDTGAYQEVSMSNFNALPRPATVLVTGDRASVIRRSETEEDVFRRDVIPEHLHRGESEDPAKQAIAQN